MIYPLDSNVWIGLIRRTSPALDARFQTKAATIHINCASATLASELVLDGQRRATARTVFRVR